MIAAIFGDVHGNLPGMYNLCSEWQDKHGHKIELVLQTGDMGLFENYEQMDSATKKHYKKDRTELAAAPYLTGKKTAPIETWFTHGNHENFKLLAEQEGQAVDPYGKIVFLATGGLHKFRLGKQSLNVAALGGMEYRFGKYPVPSNKRIQKYLHPHSLNKLQKEKPEADILLMHDAPLNKGLHNKFPTGSKRITELIEAIQPRFLFFGHYDDPPKPFRIGETFCVGTNLKRARHIPGRDGAMGILNTDYWEFSFVND